MPFADNLDPWMYAALALSLFAAGFSKGLAGIGLPVLAIPIITLFIDLQAAVKLMAFSLVASNVWQVAASRQRTWALGMYWPVVLAIPFGTLVGVYFLRDVDEAPLKAAVGAIIIVFVAFSLLQASWRMSVTAARWSGPVAGFLGGLIGGMAAIFAPPLVIFLVAAGVGKDRFVAAIGVFFLVGSLSLALFLASFSIMDATAWLWSAVAFTPVLLGQIIGGAARGVVEEQTFRKIVLFVLVVAAANMIRSVL